MESLFYDINRTYEENYKRGPVGLAKLKKPFFKATKPKFKFLGFPINMPFGIPAGPLLNNLFVKAAFDFGFSVNTYKTVRGNSFPCHPFPNVLYVKTKGDFRVDKNRKAETTNKPQSKISITNSFGVPSKKPELWQKDVKKALFRARPGELLILNFMGTTKPNQTQQKFIDDFVNTAKLASKTGVRVLEVNLSCPNIGNE
jgi:dihydroorotate dehydrogenase